MKNSATGLMFAAMFFAGTGVAQARMIKFVDDKGVTHYGDTLPAQCMGHDSAELSKRGIVVKKSERAPTAEEVQAKELEAGQRKAQAQKETEQKRRDYALLASYTNVQEIDMVRARELQRVEAAIANIKATQSKHTTEAEQQKNEAKIQAWRKEIEETNTRYDAYKARFIELKKGNAGPEKISGL